MDKNASDGEGTAKRTIWEVMKDDPELAGAIATAGATRIIMTMTNKDPSKDPYDTRIETIENELKNQSK